MIKKVVRAAVVSLLLVAVGLPVAVYVVLSMPWAQEKMRTVACDALTEFLGTEVQIDKVYYEPFNKLAVDGVRVADDAGTTALAVARIQTRFELWHFLRTGRLEFDYAVLTAPTVTLYRATPDAPLNIQPILDRLKPKDKNKAPTPFDLKIGTIVITDGAMSYDVRSIKPKVEGFDVNHISVNDLGLHAYLRHATNDGADVLIEALSLSEKSGLRISDLVVDASVSPGAIALKRFDLKLPHSRIALQPVTLELEGYSSINQMLKTRQLQLRPAVPLTISSSDLAWLWAPAAEIDRTITTDFDIKASLEDIDVNRLRITDTHGLDLRFAGSVNKLGSIDEMHFDARHLDVTVPSADVADVVGAFNPRIATVIGRAGMVKLNGSAEGSMKSVTANLETTFAGAKVSIDGSVQTPDKYKSMSFDGVAEVIDLPLGQLAGHAQLGKLTAVADCSGNAAPGATSVSGGATVHRLEYNGYSYENIDIDGTFKRLGAITDVDAALRSTDPKAAFEIALNGTLGGHITQFDIDGELANLDLQPLVRGKITNISGHLRASGHGRTIDDASAGIYLDKLCLTNSEKELKIKHLEVTLEREGADPRATLSVASDFLNGSVSGDIIPSSIVPSLRDMASHALPDLIPHDEHLHHRLEHAGKLNRWAGEFTLAKAEDVGKFFNLPVVAVYPVDFTASMDAAEGHFAFTADAPYLQQGDKIIDSTIVGCTLDAHNDRAYIYATTHMPTKKGPMTVVIGSSGAESRFDTRIDWQIDRKIPLNGRMNFSTELSLDADRHLCAVTDINPGQINFGDDMWQLSRSRVSWCSSKLLFEGFSLISDEQKVAIDGIASASPDDVLTVTLDNIHLASIFETLEIDKALIGGIATGQLTATQVFSSTPVLTTRRLHVDDIAYNYCVLGDADVTATWDNDRKAFALNADVVNKQGEHSRISGDIFAVGEALDLTFDARHVPVGFMKPFMAAFTSDISGNVSGKARLFGTFKDIDLEGDVYAEDLRIKIDFTNTWYTASDSIHISPGLIELKDIAIKDVNGHTALLGGWLRHDYFHNPVFDFRITDARDFQCYNTTAKLNPDWYGTIYGTGSAAIVGRPGVVEISADMRTDAGSTFTFVLSDRLDAEQYSFITFNDVTPADESVDIFSIDDIPEAVKEFQERMRSAAEDAPSDYVMDIKVDITPQAQMIIVMDPVGGDRIKANGTGDLRMAYNSSDNDLRMWGTYTLDRGSYNFTLQDIIIKDFTINPGSSITFRGDPYSASLDLEAVYSVNANLSDLDESFAHDKELNRTNVPVQALMKVTGDMRQPDIAFDLGFPTLTGDTYRKVRSIISTDDMMNRQIIYLLALNRFYTPDYMASTTKGNELFSVASSTISSQLSSMLGKLSDNWSIAPNLRSDRGDFSDVEVDVALSSRLLNNRLLLNGNLGYRDKSLNTNQFIGDFDVEYLLTPGGTWRLKAYNRYNDQNYYLRTAATTQGVGIMFRRDFDRLFPHKSHKNDSETPKDSAADTKSDDFIIFNPVDTVKP